MTSRSDVVRSYVRMGQNIAQTALQSVNTPVMQKSYERLLVDTLNRQAHDAAATARLLRMTGAEPAEEEAMLRYRTVLHAASGRVNGEEEVWAGGADWRVLEAQGHALGDERWKRMLQTPQIQAARAASREVALTVWMPRQSTAATLVKSEQYLQKLSEWKDQCTFVAEGQLEFDRTLPVRRAQAVTAVPKRSTAGTTVDPVQDVRGVGVEQGMPHLE